MRTRLQALGVRISFPLAGHVNGIYIASMTKSTISMGTSQRRRSMLCWRSLTLKGHRSLHALRKCRRLGMVRAMTWSLRKLMEARLVAVRVTHKARCRWLLFFLKDVLVIEKCSSGVAAGPCCLPREQRCAMSAFRLTLRTVSDRAKGKLCCCRRRLCAVAMSEALLTCLSPLWRIHMDRTSWPSVVA